MLLSEVLYRLLKRSLTYYIKQSLKSFTQYFNIKLFKTNNIIEKGKILIIKKKRQKENEEEDKDNQNLNQNERKLGMVQVDSNGRFLFQERQIHGRGSKSKNNISKPSYDSMNFIFNN